MQIECDAIYMYWLLADVRYHIENWISRTIEQWRRCRHENWDDKPLIGSLRWIPFSIDGKAQLNSNDNGGSAKLCVFEFEQFSPEVNKIETSKNLRWQFQHSLFFRPDTINLQFSVADEEETTRSRVKNCFETHF